MSGFSGHIGCFASHWEGSQATDSRQDFLSRLRQLEEGRACVGRFGQGRHLRGLDAHVLQRCSNQQAERTPSATPSDMRHATCDGLYATGQTLTTLALAGGDATAAVDIELTEHSLQHDNHSRLICRTATVHRLGGKGSNWGGASGWRDPP